MVVRLEDDAGELVGIHRTWLDTSITPDAVRKAPLPSGMPARKTLGGQGQAWLGRRDACTIIIGEGLETVLSASELGDEDWPSWGATPVSLISESGLARFVPPRTCRHLFISEDADPAGRRAATEAAERASAASVKVVIMHFHPIEEAA